MLKVLMVRNSRGEIIAPLRLAADDASPRARAKAVINLRRSSAACVYLLTYGYIVETSTPPTNIPPAVTITSPPNNTTFITGTHITVTADATDPDGAVTKVDFFESGNSIGTATNAPWSMVWSNVVAANYSLTARAIDDGGLVSTSAPVKITVSQPDCSVEIYRNDFEGSVGAEWSFTRDRNYPSRWKTIPRPFCK